MIVDDWRLIEVNKNYHDVSIYIAIVVIILGDNHDLDFLLLPSLKLMMLVMIAMMMMIQSAAFILFVLMQDLW